jgi:hypothetical protein
VARQVVCNAAEASLGIIFDAHMSEARSYKLPGETERFVKTFNFKMDLLEIELMRHSSC